MGTCCGVNYIQSKTEEFIFRIMDSTFLTKKNFRQWKQNLESHYDGSNKTIYLEAFNYLTQNFYDNHHSNNFSDYHEAIFKNLLKLIYKGDTSQKSKENHSIYWLILLIFPLIKPKIDNQTIDLNDTYANLFELIRLIKGSPQITYEDIKEIITVYLKGSLFVIFSSTYTQQLKHIINAELSNDINYNKESFYTEKNIDAFINHQFPINADPSQTINELEGFIMIIKKEILFFKDILLEFNDYMKDIRK